MSQLAMIVFYLSLYVIGFAQNIYDANYIGEYSQDRIYLKEDRIFQMEDGFHLLLDDEGKDIILPALYCDQIGYFIPMIEGYEEKRPRNFSIFNKCKWCGEPYFIRCKNPACPGKPKDSPSS